MKMREIGVGYKTGSGNVLSMTIHGQWFDRTDIPTFPADELLGLCGDCKGANGGCPAGGAPHFTQLMPSHDVFYVVTVRMNMAWAIAYAGNDDNIRKTNYYRTGYADRLTDCYLWRVLGRLEAYTGMRGLGCGNCPVCYPKDCTVMRGDKCAYPDRRRYSMEGVGVDCSALQEKMHGYRLSWWCRTDEIPIEMVRYAGIFSNDNLDDALEIAVKLDNSYIPYEDVPMPVIDYSVIEAVAPEGTYDEGDMYYAYDAI